MNYDNSSWGCNNWDRRGRGGQNRGGRGQWGRKNFRGSQSQPYGRGRYWADNRTHGNQFGQGNRNSNHKWQNRPKRDNPGKRLSEEKIGVTEYISDLKGFNGIIKSRYSDFQVSEINENGEVAELNDQTPPEPIDETVDEDEDLLLTKYNLEILPMETWDSINKIAVCKEASTEKVEIDVTGMPKEHRTKIHDAVKKAFGDVIVGSTVNVDDKKFVRFEKYRKGVRIDNRVKWIWPGEYVYFVVYKENCDTMEAAVQIAEKLRLNIKPSMLGYAGTKDRRAKTSQWFSLRKVDPRRLHAATRALHNVHVGNYRFCNKNLKLGMLSGNRFRIALRNVTADEETVEQACVHLRDHGFINYYGLQRFGTRVETPTYDVGVKLLQGNFREAIGLILEEREGPLQNALRCYAAAGAEAALRALPGGPAPHSSHAEVRLLWALAKAPNDLLGALNKLARNTRLLYLHSYQSLVWNRAVSARIQRFGLRPVEGDLVPLTDVHQEGDNDEDESDEEEGNDKDTEQESEKPNPEHQDSSAKHEKPQKKGKQNEPKPKIPVKALTKEDIESGRYTIFDVIMPLPGYNVDYPANMKDFYEEMMTKDGLELQLKHKVKIYSMSGAYRHIVVRPLHMSWELVRYTEPNADLVLSDLDKLQGRTATGIKPDGKYQALLLTITLPSSCYATMALRELLKVDTSSDNQALQNNYHKRKNTTSKSETEDKKDAGENEKDKQESEKDNQESENDKQESENDKQESETENDVEKKEEGSEAKKAKLDDDHP